MLSSGLWNQNLVVALYAVPPRSPLATVQRSNTYGEREQDSEPHFGSSKSLRIKSIKEIVSHIRRSGESDHPEGKGSLRITDTNRSFIASIHSDPSSDTIQTSSNVPSEDDKGGLNAEDEVQNAVKVNVKATCISDQQRPRSPLYIAPTSPHLLSHPTTYFFANSYTREDSTDLLDVALRSASMSESYQHRRGESFHVNWTADDVPALAKEVYDATIADVHLSLFGLWIREKDENYKVAKKHIRELALDQGYKVDRVRNLKLRKLLQETFSARPEVPGANAVDAETSPNGDPARNANLPTTDSQWLRDTLRHLENPVERGAFRGNSHDEIQTQAWPRTPSSGVNGRKQRSVSSPLVARLDQLPGSLRAHRQRILDEAARSTLRQSPSSWYPPNTSDRPAPLSIKSSSSSSLSASGAPIRRHVSSPLATSALEFSDLPESSNDVDTNFNDVIRRSVTSPRAKYRFAPPSPLSPPEHDAYQIIDKEDGDVFGDDSEEAIQSNTVTEITSILRIPHARLSTTYESISNRSSNHCSQSGTNRLSDTDWQTEASGEEQTESTDTSDEASYGMRLLRQDYEQFLRDAHEDPDGEFGLDTEDSSEYSLDPEDETDDEEPFVFDKPYSSAFTYIDTSDAGSVLETASNASDEDPSRSIPMQYSYASLTKRSVSRHSTDSDEVAIDETIDEYRIHPAFRKGFSLDADLATSNSEARPSPKSPVFNLKETINRLKTAASTPKPKGSPQASPSPAKTSPLESPPPLPLRSPLRNTLRPGFPLSTATTTTIPRSQNSSKSTIPVPSVRGASASTNTCSESTSINTAISHAQKNSAESSSPALLTQARAQAAALPPVVWATLTPFERTWRVVNRELLVRLFGRVDVGLSAEMVEVVEGVRGEGVRRW
ncbi:hypothetical protein J1614_009800 [Plenodomus biglobosus]|nr:hypothetical protein J1614_009800 [Plenodomus biglobosus]